MSFNTAKCKLLSITNERNPSMYKYNLGFEQISTETTQKYLGVTINNKLRWGGGGHYCNITAHKANRMLGIVRRLLKPCEQDVRKRAYETLVRPEMEYTTSAWRTYTDRDINKLGQVQKNAAKFVTGDYRLTTSTTCLIKSISWDPLEKRRLQSQFIMLYEIRNNLAISTNLHRAQTRSRSSRTHSYAYPVPPTRNKCTQLGLLILPSSHYRVWDSLLLEAVASKSLGQFQGLATTYIRGL